MTKTLHIERLSYGADAIAHDADGRTVFVSGGVPGDIVDVHVQEDKGAYLRATIAAVLQPSASRVESLCDITLGCPWGNVSYDLQLQAKTTNVRDALIRTGHADSALVETVVRPCIPSPEIWHYRNKMELNVAPDNEGRPLIGATQSGTGAIQQIDDYPLALPALAHAPKALRGAIRALAGDSTLGLFRVGMRTSKHTAQTEVALWTTPCPFPRAQAARMLQSALPQTTSIVRVIAEAGSARRVRQVERLSGRGNWQECLLQFRFTTSAPSFFQVNTPQAEALITEVLARLRETLDLERATIADLYAGGGTFSIPLAAAGANVYAVESAKSSVQDLRRNAQTNNADIEIIGGDTARELPNLGQLDAVVVDPPRSGLAREVPESIVAANPQAIIYVSCDPATLARDCARFAALGYTLASVQPVDLFPQTYHVETVVLMSRVKD